MRRSDREITDFKDILDIIDRCEVLRLGLSDGDFPYIVPVNFGYEYSENTLSFYIHGAQEGRKYELMKKNRVCSFEADMPLQIELNHERGSATMRYKSVMGRAEIDFLEGDEKRLGIDILMKKYPETRDFKYNTATLERTAVMRLRVIEISAKASISKRL